MRIDADSAWFSVSGAEKIWVRGMHAELEGLLSGVGMSRKAKQAERSVGGEKKSSQLDETRATLRMYGCRLGKSELERLFVIAADGFSSGDIDLYTTRNGTKITRSTLGELVDAVRASTEPGDPDIIDNLGLQAHEIGRYAYISMDKESVWVSISGVDKVWVRGTHRSIEQLLSVHGTSKRGPVDSFAFVFAAGYMSAACDLVVALLAARTSIFHHRNSLAFTLTVVIPMILVSMGWAFGRRKVGRAKVKINPIGPAVTSTGLTSMPRSDQIAAWSLLVGILGVIVALIK